VNHLNTAELKPVIYLKKRWLVLFFLITTISILTFSNFSLGNFHAAAQSEELVSETLNKNNSETSPDKEDYFSEESQLENTSVEESFQKKYDFRADYSGARMVPVYKVERDDNKIALTIDGAWGSAKTEELLALLRKYDVKTSFFFAGRWLETNQDLVEKILAEGHNIYNHSYTHPHFNSLSREEIEQELLKTEKLIARLREKVLNEKEQNETILKEKRNSDEEILQEENKQEESYLNIDNYDNLYYKIRHLTIEHRFDLPSRFDNLITEEYLKDLSRKTDLKEINHLFLECEPCSPDAIYQFNELSEYGLKFKPDESLQSFENFLANINKEQDDENEADNSDNGYKTDNVNKVQRIDNFIKQKKETPIKLFRPPYGEYNDFVVKTARELDYQIIQWSLDSHDWMDPGEEYVVNRIKTNVGAGDILLFHNNAPHIISILERLIPYLKQRYELVQIEELIYHDQYIIRSFDGLQYSVKDDEDEN